MSLWLNRFAAQAPRNGTTSHTLDWSSSFTATSGRLLVIVIGGAVTHSTPAGWTRIGNAVNVTEIDVWVKTAAGGETSVSTTHNSSNFPVGWAVYEFPSGSSAAGTVGTSTGNNGTTWAAATSLPGTAVTVFGTGTVASSNGADTASFVATSPWIEDVDFFTPFSSTDGYELAVMYQDGITASSATPVGTITASGSGIANGERITFAISVAAGGTNATPTPSVVAPPVVTIPTPTITASSKPTPATVAPPAVSIPTPTVKTSATVTPAMVVAVASIPTPTVNSHATWSVWKGDHEYPLTLNGVWNGTSIDALTFDQVTS